MTSIPRSDSGLRGATSADTPDTPDPLDGPATDRTEQRRLVQGAPHSQRRRTMLKAAAAGGAGWLAVHGATAQTLPATPDQGQPTSHDHQPPFNLPTIRRPPT